MTPGRLRFELRYLTGNAPWDHGQVPPELEEFMAGTAPGKAVEFGCGTGTNAIALARRGWQVVAVDIAGVAILRAKLKARKAGVSVDFRQGSAPEAGSLELAPLSFDFGLDIGCFHVLSSEQRLRYASHLAQLLRPGATLMIYSFLKTEEGATSRWPTQVEIEKRFEDAFALSHSEHGWYHERRSIWLTFTRRA